MLPCTPDCTLRTSPAASKLVRKFVHWTHYLKSWMFFPLIYNSFLCPPSFMCRVKFSALKPSSLPENPFLPFKTDFTKKLNPHASSEFLFSRNGNVCRYSSFKGEKKNACLFGFFVWQGCQWCWIQDSLRLHSQLFYHSRLLEQVYFPVHLNKLFPHIRLSH